MLHNGYLDGLQHSFLSTKVAGLNHLKKLATVEGFGFNVFVTIEKNEEIDYDTVVHVYKKHEKLKKTVERKQYNSIW